MPPVGVFANLGLFVRENFLSREECHRLFADMMADEGEAAGIFAASAGDVVNLDIRRAWEVGVPEERSAIVEARLAELRGELESCFHLPLADPGAASYLRYPAGAFYRAHRDRRATPDPSGAHRRAVSVVIFVNGPSDEPGFAGGNLRFYGLLGDDGQLAAIGIDAEPRAGTLVAFPSTLEHEVTRVDRGVRCSVVTWFTDRSARGSSRRRD